MTLHNGVEGHARSVESDNDQDMAAHDALPPVLRCALNYALEKQCAVTMLKALRRGWKIEDVMAEMAEFQEQLKAEHYEEMRALARGAEHR